MSTLKYILFMIGGGLIGYFGNRYANQKTEDRIINVLTAQIKELQAQITTGRTTGTEQAKIDALELAKKIIINS